MRRVLSVVLAACLMAGCASLKKREAPSKPSPAEASVAAKPAGSAGPESTDSGMSLFSVGFLDRYAASRKLAHAVELLGQGNQSAAIKELSAICNGKSMPGVTDEALFRLALLTLRPSLERPASQQGQQHLKRLRKEYPSSPWTAQAAALLDLVNVADDLKQQNRNLKASNQSLNREINDLNKTINQLKNLDLELEQKRR